MKKGQNLSARRAGAENPPWWWRPEAPPYVPPGPQRMDRGLEEYEAFRNVVRSTQAPFHNFSFFHLK